MTLSELIHQEQHNAELELQKSALPSKLLVPPLVLTSSIIDGKTYTMNAKKIAINFDNSNDRSKGLRGGSKAE
jgi:hypothetical protein